MYEEKQECWNCGNDCCCNNDLCQKCLDDSCSECGEVDGQCCCEDMCDECYCCGEEECLCDTDELDKENVADSFHPMNAFARARWLRAQQKGKNQ